MKKIIVLLSLLSLVILANAQAPHIRSADSVFRALYNQQLFNGTVLIAENGKATYQKNFGFIDAKGTTPLQASSSFNLASVSKQFFAVMTMMLQEQNKLSYDDAVQKYLADFPYPNITIRQLMNQTSGLEEYFDLATRYRGPLDTLTNEKILRLLSDLKPPLRFVPGSQWQYCNTNYAVLASLIEKVSGMRADRFLSEKITKPLGMKNTILYSHMTRPTIPNRVFGFYREQGKNKENDLTLYDGVWGDGNIYSSVEDLLKWDQALYGEKLLKQKTLREAFEPARLSDGTTYPYGFGWGILESGRVMHTGGWTGFRTMIMRDMAHNRTVIVLSNGSCDALDFRALGKLFIGAKIKVPHSTLIANVRVVDGTGLAGYAGAVRLMDNVIRETGNLQPFPNETVIDGKGMVLAPGFIDSHSHHDRGMEAQPDIVAALSQGITTVIVGQDGYGPRMDTLTAQFNRHPLAINIGSYTGHTTLRFAAMGPSGVLRTSTTQELEKMKTMMREEMDKGSLGISTGLEYESAFFSSRHEVLELAKVTAEEGGRYISHIRSEDINLSDALDEIIAIGREARLPVQVSHFKIALRDNWGTSRQLISQLENARASGVNITADVYPYDYWMSTLRVLFPKRDYQNPVSADFAVRQLFDPEGSVLVAFAANPSYAGKTVSEVARLRKESPATTLMWLVAEAEKYEKSNPDGDEDVEGIMGKSMLEEDVAQLTAWPHSNICSDGTTYGHPRGYGAFPRVFRMYVRERPVLTLEQAVYKMTGLTAEHLGLRDRGLIAPGQAADLVLFDPATISDQATIARPDALSTGVIKVWVNGTLTWNEGKAVGRSGKLIRK